MLIRDPGLPGAIGRPDPRCPVVGMDVLDQAFGTDMTAAEATCATCGAFGLVAETAVYLRGRGQWSAAGTARPCSWPSRGSGA